MARCLISDIQLKNKAIIDSATGLFTQRYLELKLETEFQKAYKKDTAISVIVIGIDSGINVAAGVIKKTSRSYDFIGRYEKEGFCVFFQE